MGFVASHASSKACRTSSNKAVQCSNICVASSTALRPPSSAMTLALYTPPRTLVGTTYVPDHVMVLGSSACAPVDVRTMFETLTYSLAEPKIAPSFPRKLLLPRKSIGSKPGCCTISAVTTVFAVCPRVIASTMTSEPMLANFVLTVPSTLNVLLTPPITAVSFFTSLCAMLRGSDMHASARTTSNAVRFMQRQPHSNVCRSFGSPIPA